MKPTVTHVIGGRRIEESSGQSPPDDPLDRDKHAAPRSPAKPGRPPVQSVTPNVSRKRERLDPDYDDPEVGPSRKLNRVVCKSVSVVAYHESDTDPDSDQDDQDYKSNSEEESAVSESTGSSHATSDGDDKEKNLVGDKLKIVNKHEDKCGYCQRPTRRAKRFCNKKCSSRYNVGCSSRVGLFKGIGVYRKRMSESLLSEARNSACTAARKSDRIKVKEKERGYPYSFAGADEDSSNEGLLHARAGSRSRSGSSVMQNQFAVKMPPALQTTKLLDKLDLLPPMRDSPEILAPPLSSPLPPFVTSPTPSGSFTKNSGSETGKKGTKGKGASRYLSPIARSYLSEKSDYVKNLIIDQPVVSWDYSEAAAFIASVQGLEHLAETILKEQVDGQCLLLFDGSTWQKGFKVKMGPSLKMVKEIKNLEQIQRKHILKQWYDERPEKFAAASAYLCNQKRN